MIHLTKGIAMTADENCFIVGKARTRADKGIVLDHPRYYTTAVQAVCAALNSAMRQGVADGSITTLRQFINEQDRLNSELRVMLAPLDSGQARIGAAETISAPSEGSYTSGTRTGGNPQLNPVN